MAAEQQQDQSMEEILQSIKRIIAEEGEATPAGSDVLELTEMVQDNGAIAMTGPKEEPAEPKIESMSLDEIMAAPIAAEPPPPPPPPSAPPPQPEPQPMPASDESLVSKETAAKSAAALQALKSMPSPETPSPPPSGLKFRSGTTIEDLVIEGLKPMLKEWLDANLPGMVERLVEREIKKLSSR